MTPRVASLFVAFAFISAPVFAQGPPSGIAGPGGLQSLASDLADLKARVSKLEGNIVVADLAGEYSVVALSTTMTAFHSGNPAIPATITTAALRATLRLNADGTGTISTGTCEGTTLTQGSWALHGVDCTEPADTVTWTYANGVATVTFLSDAEEIPFEVGLGGRLLVNAFAPFHPSDPSSDQFLLLATRLR